MKHLAKGLVAIMLITVAMAATSCKKNTYPDPAGSVNIRFNYVFGPNEVPWELNKLYVHSKTGDSLTFNTLKFYVSNIKLKKQDGTWWVHPDSYFLADASVNGGSTLSIGNVPAGTYTSMSYTMGVDSQHNVSGTYTGALSLSNAMFWDWNSGYIMVKVEGKSPQAVNGGFAFHLGGFSGADNIVTERTADFTTPLTVSASKIPVVKLVANPAKFWHSSPGVGTLTVIHAPGADAVTMAKNFYNSIYFAGIE
jgi:hypothetical protein